MISRFPRFLVAVILCLLPACSVLAQHASIPERVTQSVDDAQRLTLPGSVLPSIRSATDLGSLSASQSMNRMVLVLKRSDAQQKDLDSLVVAQQTKGSASYHKWLKPADFQARFAPAAGDLAKVTAWLQGRGFSNVTLSHSGQFIEFSGSAGTVESAFGTAMHRFSVKTASGAEEHVANATPISIPQALVPVVSGVLSLNNFTSRPLHSDFGKAARNKDGKLVRVKGETTSTDGNGNFEYFLAPGDVRKIYGATSLPSGVDGTGVSIAVIGRSDVQLTDLQTFRKIFSLPQNDPNFIVSGPDPGLTNYNDAGESTLDLEWAAAVAPNATINFVTAGSTDTTDGVALAAVYAVENVISPIMTVSYGECEKHFGPAGNLFWSSVWEQAAAEGISVLIASGDGGAASCDADDQNSPAIEGDTVSGLASTPYNLAVGGTQFAEDGLAMQYWDSNNNAGFTSALGYIPEAAWNESCDPTLPAQGSNCSEGQTYYESEGGGGGHSNCAYGTTDANGNVTCTGGYPKPAWQHGTGVLPDGSRDIPDVAMNASAYDDPYIICFLGGCQYTEDTQGNISITSTGLVGGTSVASPVMASVMALVEQKNGTYLGLPNGTFYNLAAQQGALCNSTARTNPAQGAACTFNDITSGNNSVPGLNGYGTDKADFTTTTGYDLATGLGSVNIANLVANWNSVNDATSTATVLTAGATSAKHGQPLPLAVAVTGTSSTPTGDIVLLTSKYGAGDQYTLGSNGTWSGQVADLPGGSYSLTARYGGDADNTTSTSTATNVTITPEGSKPALAVEIVDPATGNLMPDTTSNYLGYQLYFKGMVTGLSGQGTPTGTVNVLVDGANNVGSGTLTADGGIFLSSMAVPVGKHALTLQYSGDNSFNASTSAPVPVTVSKGETVSFVEIIGGPGHAIAASVSASGQPNPTGTLQIYDNNTAIGPPLPIVYDGIVGQGYPQIVTTYSFTPGPHTMTAVYSGDSNYDAVPFGSGNAYPRTVTIPAAGGTAPTTTSFVMTNASTLQMGQIATFVFTVTAKPVNGKLPTGSVNIYEDNNLLTGSTLVNGKATAIFYADAAAQYTLIARYEGDSVFAASNSSKTATLSIPKLTPATTFSAGANYVLPNSQVSLDFTATGVLVNPYVEQDPIGTVSFATSVNGAASVSLGTFPIVFINGRVGGYSGRFTLPAGTNVVTAAYPGNPNFNPVSSTTTVVVGSPDFVFTSSQSTLSVTAGASASATLTLTPELGYTGPVTLACGSGVPVGATCIVTPSSATFGAAQNATVTVSTPAPSPTTATAALAHNNVIARTLGVTSLAGLLMLLAPSSRRRRVLMVMILVLAIPFAGCGGSSSPKPSLLSLSSSNTKVASGASVTLTAKLDALVANPTGTVTFLDGSTAIGEPVALASNSASLDLSTLAVGAHTITAVYSGDKHSSQSTSSAVVQVVTGTTTLQITATSGTLVHNVTLPLTLN